MTTKASPDELFSLARAEAPWLLRNRWRVMGSAVAIITADRNPVVARADDELSGLAPLMSAPMTPANVASEDALICALLASAGILAFCACGHEDGIHESLRKCAGLLDDGGDCPCASFHFVALPSADAS